MRISIACVVGALFTAGCGLGSFDVTEAVAPQTIPGSSSVAAPPGSIFETTLNVTWDDLPHGKSWVDSITLSSATFNVKSPAQGTFDFVQSVVLSVSSPSSTTLSETEIAQGQSTAGSGTLTLKPSGDVDLLRYVKAGAMVRVTGTGTQPVDTTIFDGQVVLTVHIL